MPEGIISAEPITPNQVRRIFNLWNDALVTKGPEQVAKQYSKVGMLFPTVSDVSEDRLPGDRGLLYKLSEVRASG